MINYEKQEFSLDPIAFQITDGFGWVLDRLRLPKKRKNHTG